MDADTDSGNPVTHYFRIRSMRYLDDGNTQVSGWSAWQSTTTVTWDGRYYTDFEISSTLPGEGASLVGIEDAAGYFTATTVEAALAEILDGGILDWDFVWSDAVHDHSDWDEGGQFILDLIQVRLEGPSELTIAGGIVSELQAYHSIDTQGDAGTDDLDAIGPAPGVGVGDLLIICPAHDDRTIVVKHLTGNIYIPGGSDISLTDTRYHLLLIYTGTYWCVIGGGSGGGGGATRTYQEDHTASCDGLTNTFNTVAAFTASTTVVALNGLTLREGVGLDYVEDGGLASITLTMTPDSGLGDDLVVSYTPS
jgi:hypothetical protein